MKSFANIAILFSLIGIIFLAIGNVCDLYWWIGLISSSVGLIITFIESRKVNKRINEIGKKQDATDRSLNIIRDENNEVKSGRIDCGNF